VNLVQNFVFFVVKNIYHKVHKENAKDTIKFNNKQPIRLRVSFSPFSRRPLVAGYNPQPQ